MNQHALELLSLYLPPDRLAQVLSALRASDKPPEGRSEVLEWRALAKEQTALLFQDGTLSITDETDHVVLSKDAVYELLSLLWDYRNDLHRAVQHGEAILQESVQAMNTTDEEGC